MKREIRKPFALKMKAHCLDSEGVSKAVPKRYGVQSIALDTGW